MQTRDGIYIYLTTSNLLSTENLIRLTDFFADHELDEFHIEHTGKIDFYLTTEKNLSAILNEIRNMGLKIVNIGLG